MATEVIRLTAESLEEFQTLSHKMVNTLERWSKKFPNFEYAFVGSTETLEITIEIAYIVNECNTKNSTHISKGDISGEESHIKGRFRSSDFSI